MCIASVPTDVHHVYSIYYIHTMYRPVTIHVAVEEPVYLYHRTRETFMYLLGITKRYNHTECPKKIRPISASSTRSIEPIYLVCGRANGRWSSVIEMIIELFSRRNPASVWLEMSEGWAAIGTLTVASWLGLS